PFHNPRTTSRPLSYSRELSAPIAAVIRPGSPRNHVTSDRARSTAASFMRCTWPRAAVDRRLPRLDRATTDRPGRSCTDFTHDDHVRDTGPDTYWPHSPPNQVDMDWPSMSMTVPACPAFSLTQSVKAVHSSGIFSAKKDTRLATNPPTIRAAVAAKPTAISIGSAASAVRIAPAMAAIFSTSIGFEVT